MLISWSVVHLLPASAASSFSPFSNISAVTVARNREEVCVTKNRMHIPPEVWGPFFWHTIHIVALGYPMEPSHAHKKAAKEFYESLRILIPCPICKEHYNVHLEKYPLTPHLDRRTDLFRWTIVLHNEVNKTLNKRTYTEAEVIDYYRRLGERGKSPVISMDDFIAGDTRSFVQGLGIGLASAAAVAGVFFLLDTSK